MVTISQWMKSWLADSSADLHLMQVSEISSDPKLLRIFGVETLPTMVNQQNASTRGGTNPVQPKAQDALD